MSLLRGLLFDNLGLKLVALLLAVLTYLNVYTDRPATAEEKLRIVLTGMQPGVEVADLCRREGLNPTLFYLWKKQLLGSAAEVFSCSISTP